MGKVLHNPYRLGGPHHFRAGGGEIHKWPASGQRGYITPAAWGVLTASERGAEWEVAHKWATWLHNPCRLGGPQRFRAEGRNQKWPTSGQGGYITPLACCLGGPQRFRAGGQNHKWLASGERIYITPTAWGVPTASERGAKAEVAHKWVRCYITLGAWGVPTALEPGGRIRSGPQVGKVLHNPYRLGGPHGFKAGRQNQKRPTSGQRGYIPPAT